MSCGGFSYIALMLSPTFSALNLVGHPVLTSGKYCFALLDRFEDSRAKLVGNRSHKQYLQIRRRLLAVILNQYCQNVPASSPKLAHLPSFLVSEPPSFVVPLPILRLSRSPI